MSCHAGTLNSACCWLMPKVIGVSQQVGLQDNGLSPVGAAITVAHLPEMHNNAQCCAGQKKCLDFNAELEASKLSCNGREVHLCMVMISDCQQVNIMRILVARVLMMLPWQLQTISTGTFVNICTYKSKSELVHTRQDGCLYAVK